MSKFFLQQLPGVDEQGNVDLSVDLHIPYSISLALKKQRSTSFYKEPLPQPLISLTDWINTQIEENNLNIGDILPADSPGFLQNDGNGNLAWSAGTNGNLNVVLTTIGYSATTNDDVILIDPTSNTINILIPSSPDGKQYKLKALNIDNTVTVLNAGGTIDGNANFVFEANTMAISVVSYQNNLYII